MLSKSKMIYARFCVLADFSKELLKSIKLVSKFGDWNQIFEFENANVKCSICNPLGHQSFLCKGPRAGPPNKKWKRKSPSQDPPRESSQPPVEELMEVDKAQADLSKEEEQKEDLNMEESHPPQILSSEAPPIPIANKFDCLLERSEEPVTNLSVGGSPGGNPCAIEKKILTISHTKPSTDVGIQGGRG
eukprot:Gb_16747 [translate_table: standard]